MQYGLSRANTTLVVFSLLLTFSQVASAVNVFNSGDWSVDDSKPGSPDGICTASTAGYLNRTVYSLNLVIDKEGLRPLEFFLRPENGKGGDVKTFVTEANGNPYYFSKINTPEQAVQYWNIPAGSAALVAAIKADRQINFQVVDVNGEQGVLPLSLSGATLAIEDLQRRCGARSLFTAADFENLFLPLDRSRLNPAQLNPATLVALREAIAKGVEAYRAVLQVREQLRVLAAQFADLTAESNALVIGIESANRDLPRFAEARRQAQLEIDQAMANIASLQAIMVLRQADLARAHSDSVAAVAALSPYLPEIDRLNVLVNNTWQQLSSARLQLPSLEQNVLAEQQRVGQLERDEDSAIFSLGAASAELAQARNQQSRADADLRAFNVSVEIDRRVRGDRRLQDLEADIRLRQGQLAQARRQTQEANRFQELARAELIRCQNGPRPAPPVPRPAPPVPRPGPGPRPAPAPAPTPVPPPNCSFQRDAVARAEIALTQARTAERNIESELNLKVTQSQNIHRQIELDVDRANSALVRTASLASLRFNQAEGEVQRLQSRLDSIRNFERPAAQNQLATVTRQRDNVRRAVDSAQLRLSELQSQLENYKQVVNFDRLRNEVNRTAAIVNNLRSNIADLSERIESNQRAASDQRRARDLYLESISTTTARLAEQRARLVEVQQALEPYEAQKAAIDAQLAVVMQALRDVGVEYAQLLP